MNQSVHGLNGRKISEILRSLPEQFSAEYVTLGELKEALPGRAYGIFLLVLALPNMLPIPLPGISAMLGAPLLLFTFQLMLGKETPWFPNFIAKRRLKVADVERICARVQPHMRRVERVIRPRLKLLVSPPADRIVALICVVLSLLIMLPIPFGNALPGLAIGLFALAILQRDGALVLLGLLVTVVALVVVSAFVGGIAVSVDGLLVALGGM